MFLREKIVQKNKFVVLAISILFACLFCMAGVFSSPVFARAQIVSQPTATTGEELDSAYSLFDVQGFFVADDNVVVEGLPKNVGDQAGTSLCWAFATLTALETTIYKAYPEYQTTGLNFSELDMAYNLLVEMRGRSYVSSANFELAFEYLSAEYGPKYEQSWETRLNWDSSIDLTNSYASGLQTHETIDSEFSVFESYSFPARSGLAGQDAKQALRNSIKYHIKNYGAVCASISMDKNSVYYNNASHCFMNKYSLVPNHMITLVGWDDNYKYNSDANSPVGAYIAQNSYGTAKNNNGYFYIMYDDALVEEGVKGFVRVGKRLESSIDTDNVGLVTYDNSYGSSKDNQFQTYVSDSRIDIAYMPITTTTFVGNIYQKSNDPNQKIYRLKVPTVCPFEKVAGNITSNFGESNFSVYILDNLPSSVTTTTQAISDALSSGFAQKTLVQDKNGSSIFTSHQTGFYTIELGSNALDISGDYFAIIIELNSGYLIYNDNNQDGYIPTYNRTYLLSDSSWNYYDDGEGNECVIPLMIQTISGYELFDCTIDGLVAHTFDGTFVSPTYEVTYPATYTVTYDLGDGETTTVPTFKNAGEYSLVVRLYADGFVTVCKQVLVVISPKVLTIRPLATSKVYGERDDIAYIVDEEYESDLRLSGRLSREEGEDVGSYAITIGNISLSSYRNALASNYHLEFVENVMFSITPRDLYIAPKYTTKVYGEADPTIAYTYSNTIDGQRPNMTIDLYYTEFFGGDYLNAGECHDVGLYDVQMSRCTLSNSLTGFKAINYRAVLVGFEDKFEILPRALVVIPDAMEKIYGEADPEFTYSYSNLVSGEEPRFVNSISRTVGEEVGHYNMNLGSLELRDNGDFKSSNYTLYLDEENQFSILYGVLTDYTIGAPEYTYDGQMHYPQIDCPDDVTIEYYDAQSETYTSEPIGYTDAGNYVVGVRLSRPNYQSVTRDAAFSILPRELRIMPISSSKVYGEEDSYSFEYTNFVHGQTPKITGSLAHEGGEQVGEYVFTLGTLQIESSEAFNFNANNYTLVLYNCEAKFTITKRPIYVEAKIGQGKIYGSADKSLEYTFSNVLPQDEVTISGNLSRAAGEDVGDYQICFDGLYLKSGYTKNYYLVHSSAPTYFTIYPVSIDIVIEDKTVYFGEIDTDFTYRFKNRSATSFAKNDDLCLVYRCVDSYGKPMSTSTAKNADGYEITAVSQNPNYIVNITSGRYYVKYRDYQATFDVLGRRYNLVLDQFSYISQLPQGVSLDRDGYDFVGWKTADNDIISDLSGYMIEDDCVFTAQYSLKKYNISYNLNGGEFTYSVKNYFYLTSSFDLPEPSRYGYDFGGWYKDSKLSSSNLITTVDGQNELNDLNLYAKWTAYEYDVTFAANQSQQGYRIIPLSDKAQYDSSYTFFIRLDNAHDKSYDNLRVYIVWADSGERELVEPTIIESYSELFFAPNALEARQSRIAQVCLDRQIEGAFSVEVEGITLNTYTVSFVASGNVVAEFEVAHGEPLLEEIPLIPAKAHFEDTAPIWSENDFDCIERDMVVKAQYTPNKYLVTLKGKDGRTFEQYINYGDAVDKEALSQNYNLGQLQYIEFYAPTTRIDHNQTIYYSVETNVLPIYRVILIVIAVLYFVYIVVNAWHYAYVASQISKKQTKEQNEDHDHIHFI